MSSRHHQQPLTSIAARTARTHDSDLAALAGPTCAPIVHGADPEMDAAMLVIDQQFVERLARIRGEVAGGRRASRPSKPGRERRHGR